MAVNVTSWARDTTVGGAGLFGAIVATGYSRAFGHMNGILFEVYEWYLDRPEKAEQDRLGQFHDIIRLQKPILRRLYFSRTVCRSTTSMDGSTSRITRVLKYGQKVEDVVLGFGLEVCYVSDTVCVPKMVDGI